MISLLLRWLFRTKITVWRLVVVRGMLIPWYLVAKRLGRYERAMATLVVRNVVHGRFASLLYVGVALHVWHMVPLTLLGLLWR